MGVSPRVRLTRSPIGAAEVLRAVRGGAFGGVVLFLGDVRAREGRRLIAAIEYEAYASMAARELARAAARAQARHGARVAVVHRLGRVPAGESSVAVAAAAAHRAEAFAACREVLEALKARAPIWKAAYAPARRRRKGR